MSFASKERIVADMTGTSQGPTDLKQKRSNMNNLGDSKELLALKSF